MNRKFLPLKYSFTLVVLLHVSATVMAVPQRILGDKCSKADIVINQGPTAPLPNGTPAYTVEIANVSPSGSAISDIHVTCGGFSSSNLVDPQIFKLLSYNDCLVNDGKILNHGAMVQFTYSNKVPYTLTVSSVVCS